MDKETFCRYLRKTKPLDEAAQKAQEEKRIQKALAKKLVGLRERNPLLHTAVEQVANFYIKEFHIEGEDHLEQVRQLLNQQKKVMIAANHISNLDAAAIDLALDSTGFSDIAKRVVNIYGIKLEQSKMTRFLGRAYSVIPVWPPKLEPENEVESAYMKRLQETTEPTFEHALEEGRVVTIFPESTRSRSGYLSEGKTAVSPFFTTVPDTWVLPIALEGTNKIWPIQGQGKIQRGDVHVTICEPLSMDAIKARHADLKHKPFRQAVMTDIMTPIAAALPQDMRGHYRDHIEELEQFDKDFDINTI